MSFCIPHSEYLANPDLYDLVSGPQDGCADCVEMISIPTSTGTNIQLNVINQVEDNVGLSLNFSNIIQQGSTSVLPLGVDTETPNITGNFYLNESLGAFQINTTAIFSGIIFLKFVLPEEISQSDFNSVRIFKSSNGVSTDVTVLIGPNAPNYTTRTIYASVDGFSMFHIFLTGVIGENDDLSWGRERGMVRSCSAEGIVTTYAERSSQKRVYDERITPPPGALGSASASLQELDCWDNTRCGPPKTLKKGAWTSTWVANGALNGPEEREYSDAENRAGRTQWEKLPHDPLAGPALQPFATLPNHHCLCESNGFYACRGGPPLGIITAWCAAIGGTAGEGPCKAVCCDQTNGNCQDMFPAAQGVSCKDGKIFKNGKSCADQPPPCECPPGYTLPIALTYDPQSLYIQSSKCVPNCNHPNFPCVNLEGDQPPARSCCNPSPFFEEGTKYECGPCPRICHESAPGSLTGNTVGIIQCETWINEPNGIGVGWYIDCCDEENTCGMLYNPCGQRGFFPVGSNYPQ